MKILFLATEINYGGACKMLTTVANGMADYGHNVVFLTYRNRSEKTELNERVRYEHFDLENGLITSVKLLHTSFRLRQYIKKNGFDVVIAFLKPSTIRMILACRGTKAKTIVSERGDPYQSAAGLKSMIGNILSKIAFLQADKIVFQTEKAKEFYPRRIHNRSVIIPNPVFVGNANTVSRSGREKRIVSVGRLDINQKRQDLLIDAFALISGKYSDYTLEFFGGGNDEAILKRKAAPYRNVIFKGVSSNVIEDIRNAALFVLSSDFEGMPNALMEAMAIGLPCISTDCSPGGAALLIEQGVNGILVPRGDARQLADGMDYMLSDIDRAEKMGIEARKINERFSLESIMKKWNELIKQST